MQLNLSGQEVNRQNIHSVNIKSSFINIYRFKGNELNKILASKSLKKVNGEICYFIVFLIYFEHLVNCMQKLGVKHEDTNIVMSELTALINCDNYTASSSLETSSPRVNIETFRGKQLKLSEQKSKENLTFYRIPKLFVIGLLILNKKPTALISTISKNTNKPTIDSKLLNLLSNSQDYLPSNIQHIIEHKRMFESSIIDLSDKTLSKWRTQYRNFKRFITANTTNQNNNQIILEIVNGKSQDTSIKEFHKCLYRKDVLEIASWLLESNQS